MPTEKPKLGETVILKHIQKGVIVRHEQITKSGVKILEDDPRFKEVNNGN